jgi:hypothetical protein
MLTDVSAKNARSGKGLVAVDTFVGSLATMHPHVLVQARRLTETLPTYRALVGPVFFVHVQNMYAKPIALLEGARA